MSTASDHLVKWTQESRIVELLKLHYNIDVNDAALHEQTICIKTNLGNFSIKKISTEQKNNWRVVADLYQHIGENSEAYFPIHAPRITTSAKPYFNGYQGSYVVLPWIDGAEISLERSADWGKTSIALANFHHATKGFRQFNLFGQEKHTKVCGDRWRKESEKIKLYSQAVKLTNEPTSFDLNWLEQFKYINGMADDVVTYYERINGDKICKKVAALGNICYGNIRKHNMLLTDKNELRFLNWSNLRCDMRLFDIKELLIYAYGRTKDKDVIAHILQTYSQTYNIPDVEYNLIYASIVFPERMYALLDAVYEQGLLKPQEAMERMVKVAKFETKKFSLIRDYVDVVKSTFGVTVERIDWIHR